MRAKTGTGLRGTATMKKWLAILMILALSVLGVAWWLAGKATAAKPEPGEVRLEIEDVL